MFTVSYVPVLFFTQVCVVLLNCFDGSNGCNRYATLDEPCMDVNYNTGYLSSKIFTPPSGYTGVETTGTGYSCNPYKMLTCNAISGTCQCPDYYNYYWDNYRRRCFIKIGAKCSISLNGLFGDMNYNGKNDGCPEYAICNPTSGYCSCRPPYVSTYYAASGTYTTGWGCSAATSVFNFNQVLVFSGVSVIILILTRTNLRQTS